MKVVAIVFVKILYDSRQEQSSAYDGDQGLANTMTKLEYLGLEICPHHLPAKVTQTAFDSIFIITLRLVSFLNRFTGQFTETDVIDAAIKIPVIETLTNIKNINNGFEFLDMFFHDICKYESCVLSGSPT